MNAPAGAPGRPAFRALAQALKVSMILGPSALVLALAAFVAAAFLHRASLVRVGMALLAVCMASQAVPHVGKLWWALRQGRWTSWRGEAVWRHERPGWYWRVTAREAVIAVVLLAATVWLIWLSAT